MYKKEYSYYKPGQMDEAISQSMQKIVEFKQGDVGEMGYRIVGQLRRDAQVRAQKQEEERLRKLKTHIEFLTAQGRVT